MASANRGSDGEISLSEHPIKVLYLSYDGLSDHIGQSQILPYIIACSKKGIQFHLLTFEKRANAEKITQLESILKGHHIVWHRLNFTKGRNILYKTYDFMRFVAKAFALSARNRYSIIHSRSYFASNIALLVKYLLGPKLIFDKRDFWIDAQVETGRLHPAKLAHKPVYHGLRFFERRLFLHADHIISLTENAKEITLQRYPTRTTAEISVIPCCVDNTLFNPKTLAVEDIEKKREALNLKDATVLGYVGSIGPTYMIPELLDCFNVFKKKIDHLKLLFLVNNDREDVYKIVEAKGLTREEVIVMSATRDSMPLYISLFDAGIFFITPTFAKKATSPTKLSEMLAMKKPVITNKGVGDVEKIFADLDCGYLISDFTNAEYEKAADWLSQNACKEIEPELNKYSLQYGSEQYHKVYTRLAQVN